jgi:hypothetical protein
MRVSEAELRALAGERTTFTQFRLGSPKRLAKAAQFSPL